MKSVVVIALGALWAAAALAADPVPELRYQWKAGQLHMYAVTIEADYGDYIEVMTGNPVYEIKSADQDGIKLTFRGGLAEKQQLKPDQKGLLLSRPRSPFSPFTGVGAPKLTEMAINRRGETISSKGSSQLPFLLGDLSTLMLDPLPKGTEPTWKTSVPLNLVEGGLPRMPFSGTDNRTQTKATLETTFTVGKVTDDAVEVTRKVEMTTAETVGGKPRIEIEGTGTLTFDRKFGGFVKGEATHRITFRDAKNTNETPLKISYRLLTDAEKATVAKTADGSLLFPAEPLADDLQQQVLADLKSGDKSRLLKALNLLAAKEPARDGKEPGKRHAEIAQALEGLLNGPEKLMKFPTSKALVNWATKETVPTLLKHVNGDDLLSRHCSMEALGKLKVEEAAEPISKRLAETSDRFKARPALEALGPKAEKILRILRKSMENLIRATPKKNIEKIAFLGKKCE